EAWIDKGAVDVCAPDFGGSGNTAASGPVDVPRIDRQPPNRSPGRDEALLDVGPIKIRASDRSCFGVGPIHVVAVERDRPRYRPSGSETLLDARAVQVSAPGRVNAGPSRAPARLGVGPVDMPADSGLAAMLVRLWVAGECHSTAEATRCPPQRRSLYAYRSEPLAAAALTFPRSAASSVRVRPRRPRGSPRSRAGGPALTPRVRGLLQLA